MVRWRPQLESDGVKKQILVSVGGDGRILHWDIGQRKVVHEIKEADNELFCIDYSPDGTQFATAGKKLRVQVYDETRREPLFKMGNEIDKSQGHSNRAFSLKYHPIDPNVLVTGSWDDMVKFWDLRQGTRQAVRYIAGPHVCADSVDISSDGMTVLTGSWSTQKQLQTWNYADCKPIDTFHWRKDTSSQNDVCKVYAAQFSKHDGSSMVVAGGSGVEEVKVFDWKSNWALLGEVVCPTNEEGWCQSVDFSNDGQYLAIGGSKGCIRVLNTFKV
jgi:WD40 repeat protein